MLDKVLLQIAKNSILSKFDLNYFVNSNSILHKYDFLNELGACFVTLHLNGRLRGCIGSIVAHRKLIDDISLNAVSAAFNDPRFSPLRLEELVNLELEVSILSSPEALDYTDFDDLVSKIRPKADGLIFNFKNYRGTFLPQVWDQLPDSREFLEHLAYKAGTNPSIYEEHPYIYRYQVEAISEKFNAILPLE